MTLDEQITDLKNKTAHLKLQRTLTTFEIDRLTVEIEQISNKIWMLQEELKEQKTEQS
jgi:prefoldin subunit 5